MWDLFRHGSHGCLQFFYVLRLEKHKRIGDQHAGTGHTIATSLTLGLDCAEELIGCIIQTNTRTGALNVGTWAIVA